MGSKEFTYQPGQSYHDFFSHLQLTHNQPPGHRERQNLYEDAKIAWRTLEKLASWRLGGEKTSFCESPISNKLKKRIDIPQSPQQPAQSLSFHQPLQLFQTTQPRSFCHLRQRLHPASFRLVPNFHIEKCRLALPSCLPWFCLGLLPGKGICSSIVPRNNNPSPSSLSRAALWKGRSRSSIWRSRSSAKPTRKGIPEQLVTGRGQRWEGRRPACPVFFRAPRHGRGVFVPPSFRGTNTRITNNKSQITNNE